MKPLIKKRILIIGASGFIGSHLMKFLKKKKFKVVGIDNFSRKRINNHQKINELYIHNCSIFNKKKIYNYILKADIIIHLAAINGTVNFYNRPSEVFEIGARGSIVLHDILNAIYKKTKIKKDLLIASSGEVYGQPIYTPTDEKIPLKVDDIHNDRFSYGGGKIVQDLVARYLISKITNKCILFRPHNVYGPNMGYEHVIPELFMKSLNSEKILFIEGTGKETRSFCYIEDFINGLFLLIKKRSRNFEIFNIGNNEEINIISLAKKINIKLGKNLIIKNKNIKKGGTTKRVPNINKLKKIGYKIKYNLNKGLDEFLKKDIRINEM